MQTPARNQDLRHVRTGLSAFEIHEACNESKKLQEAAVIAAQIAYLGPRYLCSKQNAPAKGVYNALTGLRLA